MLELGLDLLELGLRRDFRAQLAPRAVVPVARVAEVALHAMDDRVDPVREAVVLVVLDDEVRLLPVAGEGVGDGGAEGGGEVRHDSKHTRWPWRWPRPWR